MKSTITQKRLKELLSYDPETGIFTWVKTRNHKALKGDIAGSFNDQGYKTIMLKGKNYRASRLAWLYMSGYFPEYQIDHINRNRSDDRWENLRHVTPQCNNRNRERNKNNSSGIAGISFLKISNKWRARIMVNWKEHPLGCYKDFADAVCARLAAEQCLNWDGCDSNSSAYQYVKRMLA